MALTGVTVMLSYSWGYGIYQI